MSWTAIVPLNLGRLRKTRLAGRFDSQQRQRLADALALHVVECLRAAPEVARILVLSPKRPTIDGVHWRPDRGRGLNAELEDLLADQSGDILVVHGDLPLLTAGDIEALLDAAAYCGIAIGPDSAGSGTNALAMSEGFRIAMEFGPESFARHRRATARAAVINRQGLALDIDTSEDFEAAVAAGWIYRG